MAAGAWTLYNQARRYIMDGTLDINTNAWRLMLCTSASNAGTTTLSTKSQLTSEVAEAFGYSSSGKALPNVKWTIGASAGEMKFTCDAFFWSAAGGDINAVKFGVIFDPASGKLLCRSQLSTAQFAVTNGNRLTITPAATGIFYVR